MMVKLSLWFDPSASMSKGIYRLDASPPQFMMMESAYLPVERSSIEAYQKKRNGSGISAIAPERTAWVRIDAQYYVVGELAQTEFSAYDHLRYLKHETLVPKIVAMVGAIATSHRLENQFDLDLAVLIPYGEKRDAITFKSEMIDALRSFQFKGKQYEVSVTDYMAKPEGYGVLVEGSTVSFASSRILVLMVGYRNASYLLSDRGHPQGETCDLGFSQMLDEVVQLTSGYTAKDLVAAISESGVRLKEKPLLSVLRKTSEIAREKELETLIDAVKKAQISYLSQLSQWWESRKFPEVEEVILAGGTGRYYKAILEQKVQGLSAFLAKKPKIRWASKLESEVKQKLVSNQQKEYDYRLTDLYGYYKIVEKKRVLSSRGGRQSVSA